MVGYLAVGASLGGWFLKRVQPEKVVLTGWRIGAALAGILVLALVGQVPIVGGLLIFAALLMGMGAVVLQVRRSMRPASPDVPQAAQP